MSLVRFAPAAADDLDALWIYIAKNGSREAANRQLGRVFSAIDTASNAPGIGRGRDELEIGCSGLPVGSLIVFYRAIEGGIEVSRVLDGRRDIERVWKKSEENA